MPRAVRVLLRNGDEKTFDNAEFKVDYRSRVLRVYTKDWDQDPDPTPESVDDSERQHLADFSLDTIRFYEYFIDE